MRPGIAACYGAAQRQAIGTALVCGATQWWFRDRLLHALQRWLAGGASLQPAQRCDQASTFLGFELWPGGRRRRPVANLARAAQRLAALWQAWASGPVDKAALRQRLNGWVAHARHRPGSVPGGGAGPAFQTGVSAARVVRGASINNDDNRLRLANRNRNTPGNRNNNIGFRLVARIPRCGPSGAAHGPHRSDHGVSRPGPARLGPLVALALSGAAAGAAFANPGPLRDPVLWLPGKPSIKLPAVLGRPSHHRLNDGAGLRA